MRNLWLDIVEAYALLTRFPPLGQVERSRGAGAAWAYPLAGVGVGLAAALAASLTAGLSPSFTAGLTLAVMVLATGALHEDGLADTADGLWGGWSRQKRLDIMKDSHIGTYGVLALLFSVGLRWVGLTTLAQVDALWWGVLLIAIVSRAPMVAVMYALPNARGDGLSYATGRPSANAMFLALGIAAIASIIVLGFSAMWLGFWLVCATLAVIVIARVKIAGQTGDVLGACQQISEITILAVLLAISSSF